MLMHHSEPLADANDPPREVNIQLQQLEAHNSAPPAQPTESTPFAPPAENDSEQNYMANANDPPPEVSIQLQQLAGDVQQEEDRNSAPLAPPIGSTPFAPHRLRRMTKATTTYLTTSCLLLHVAAEPQRCGGCSSLPRPPSTSGAVRVANSH